LVYSKDGDRYVIIASKAGAPENPSWYHNLLGHPEVTVEIGSEKKAKASAVEEAAAQLLPEEPRNCGELSNRGARRATRSRRLRQHPPAYA
jgi:deazaflavin-dependent oxidoreductase (nitroreductase family)